MGGEISAGGRQHLEFAEHPLRRGLANEVHARPYELLRAPVRASHVAVLGDGGDRERVAALCARFSVAPPEAEANYLSADFGGFRLRWERHAEFSTFTVFRLGDGLDPFADTALAALPAGWLADLEGVLVAMHVAVMPGDQPTPDLSRLFAGHQVIGSRVQGGAAEAWTDFRLHGDGFGRVLVRDHGLTPGQTGRLVQRLLEIETYRMMALLAFPLAREAVPKLSRIDDALSDIVARMAEGARDDDDRPLLDRLTRLAAECEQVSATTSFRLSAARAYDAIVRQRIEELREERIPGLQTIGEFMGRRLAPAMNTCRSTAERQDALAARVARAGSLLRTRVDIALEEKNRDLLRSMNRRARLQLRLQETVEGLSVVAISYYVVGLVGYAAKGAKAAGTPVDPDIAVLAALPLVVGLVWLGVRRLRRALGHGGEDG